MFKRHLIKLNHIVLRKKRNTYGAPVFAPDYSATVLAAKLCTNSHLYIRFLCIKLMLHLVHQYIDYFLAFHKCCREPFISKFQ
jgi:hypothetical protein